MTFPNAVSPNRTKCQSHTYYRNISKLLFFKLNHLCGLAISKSISGVKSSCSVFRILGGVTKLAPVPALMPVCPLNTERVGDGAKLKSDSVGLGTCDHGPPRRRMMRDSSEARHSRFCEAVGCLVSICWRRDCRWDAGRDVGRDVGGCEERGRER
jgi:hypothetical protein